MDADYLQPKLSCIPAYMPVSLDVARGFKYGTSAQFQLFGKELQNAVRSFDKLPPTLCHGKPCRAGFKYVEALGRIIII